MPDCSPNKFDLWKDDVSQAMKRKYCIDIADAGLDDNQLNSFQDMLPEEFVDWFGKKYDLIPIARVLTFEHTTSMKF